MQQNSSHQRMPRPNGAPGMPPYPPNQYQQPMGPVMHRPQPRMPYAGGNLAADSRFPTFMPSPSQQYGPSSMPDSSHQDPRYMRASTTSPPPHHVPTSRSASRNSFQRSGSQGVMQQGSSNRPMSNAPVRYPESRVRPFYDGASPQASNSRPHMPMMPSSTPIVPNVNNAAAHHRLSVDSNSYPTQGDTSPSRHTSQSHNVDECPGCQQDFEAALKASEASAREDMERRERLRTEEEEHWKAVKESEEYDRRRKEAEEEMLRLVIAESQRDEEEARIKRLREQNEEEEHRLLLLEESRQSALREDEERIRLAHAELLERSKREAEAMARRRQQEEERLQAMEAAIVEQSRREMEEEWRRRDEEERAMEEYARRGGKQGEAGYWQHLDQNQAYDLAMQMNQSMSNEAASSSRVSRRPLPPTPGLAAQAAGVESPSPNGGMEAEGVSWEHDEDDLHQGGSDGEDPFGDGAEAPPSYDDVRTDRPPEAPATIPDHIRFAPPPQAIQAAHNNTLAVPVNRSEKTPLSPNVTPRPRIRELDAVQEESASTSNTPPFSPAAAPLLLGSTRGAESDSSLRVEAPVPLLNGINEQFDANSIRPAVLNRTESQTSTSSASANETFDQSRRTSASTIHSMDSARSSLQQRTMKGTDFGYCNEPFSSKLGLSEGEDDKKHFPSVIQLKKISHDAATKESNSYFVILAPSWKMLLRALAWYGNTRIEAGPEEVADSSSNAPNKALRLRLELEFVTPSKVELASMTSAQKTIRNAHVSVCMSLLEVDKNAASSALKQLSREKDASYLRKGSTRRVITLPSHAPALPLAMVRLAQHLHQAHVFSAACPSTSQTALHSPRDLTRAIEKHDFTYVAKLQKLRKEADNATTDINTSSNNSKAKVQVGDDEDGHHDAFDAGAVGLFEGAETSESSMSRLKAKMKRKLVKRSGDSNAVDQDLESWITPFDVNQHG